MSMKGGPSSSSSSNNNSNHMSARRGSTSRRISESSLGSVSTASTSTSQRQQHVADKAAVKRKKRRKDEEDKEAIAAGMRVPVVLLTRLENDKIKSNESLSKKVTNVSVVIERANDIESIKAPSSVKPVAFGKKSTRNSLHRSSDDLASSNAKTLEPISEVKDKEEKVVVKESVKAQPKESIESSKNSDQTDSKSSKVKSDQESQDNLAEPSVNNVNNDNLKKIGPKIIQRQLVVRLDRLEVKSFLEKKCLQRLCSKDNLTIETDENHSESKTQDNDVLSKISKEIKTCAIPSDTNVTNETKILPDLANESTIDEVTGKAEEAQQGVKKPVETAVKKKRGRPPKKKNVKQTAEVSVKNQRLSWKGKKMVKSREAADEKNKDASDKDLRGNTKIYEESSVQMNENQIEHLHESPKDTSCESAKNSGVISPCSLSNSRESLNDSAVDSEQDSSRKSKTDEINNVIIESNSNSDKIIPEAEPVLLPIEVDTTPHNSTVLDDSKAEDDSAQQICDIHSKSVDEVSKTLFEESKTTGEISFRNTESLYEDSVDSKKTESLSKNLENGISNGCPAKHLVHKETSKLSNKSSVDSGLSELPAEDVVNIRMVESPTDSFVSCENGESSLEDSMHSELNDSFIENLEDTESIASTCTLIEETPEDLHRVAEKELEIHAELPPQIDTKSEAHEKLAQEVDKELENTKDLPQEVEKEAKTVNTSLQTDKLDRLSLEDKIDDINEHESFENNLKSVENLVIDSILNGEIVSPKIITQSATTRVGESQTFVFESGVDDFVSDSEIHKETTESLEPSTPVEEAHPTPESFGSSLVVEEASAIQNCEAQAPVEAPAVETNVELVASIEEPTDKETLPVKSLVVEENNQLLTAVEVASTTETSNLLTTINEPVGAENSLDSSHGVKEALTDEIFHPPSTVEQPDEDTFAKHRRKHTLMELKKKCTENIDKRHTQAFEILCNDIDHEEPQPLSVFNEKQPADSDLHVPSSVISSDCYLEPGMNSRENYFEDISDADSEVCLADRLNQVGNPKIPSTEEASSSLDKSVQSEGEDSSREQTKRQRILMKITKTDANKHVTHLVDSKDEEAANNEQLADEPVAEGEIKIIVRKESSSNNHVIKEIKIIPRTPDGGNSARIPGYSPTSSDLSSGNSSCRVPSCSPAKPDSGSYRMPGWSPASTETGQTTIKKKPGRPRKYPIFTDAELIAKTTAIVNNGEVNAKNVTEKPLFEPVESIRINEANQVEEESHQMVITDQTCLSGDQLLEAMPAKADIMENLRKKVEGDQSLVKKKRKMNRPRKYPLLENVVADKSIPRVIDNVTVARIEFKVVDSIEEFVEPPKEIAPVLPVSPMKKKRGRPRKNLSQDGEKLQAMTDATPEDVLVKKKVSRKSKKFTLDNSTAARDSLVVESALSMLENETLENVPATEKTPKKRGRKSYKLSQGDITLPENVVAGEANSMTESESTTSDVTKVGPIVKKRGRKSQKHLQESPRRKLAVEEVYSTSEDDSNDGTVEPITNKRRGKLLLQLLQDDIKLQRNAATEEANLTNTNETDELAPAFQKIVKKKRGRKPRKQLENDSILPENLVAEEANSMTEDESADDKQSQENITTDINLITEEDNSMTANELVDSPPIMEKILNIRRKSLKLLQDENSSTSENVVVQGTGTMTENEIVNDTSVDEKTQGRKTRRISQEDLVLPQVPPAEIASAMTGCDAADNTSTVEPIVKKKRGPKPKMSLEKELALLEKRLEREAEDESANDPLAVETVVKRGRGRPPKYLPGKAPYLNENRKRAKLMKILQERRMSDLSAGKVSFITEDEIVKRTRQSIKAAQIDDTISDGMVAEDASSMTENETVDNTTAVESVVKEKTKSRNDELDDSTLSEKIVPEETDPLMGTETIDDTAVVEPIVKKRGRSRKLSQDNTVVAENLLEEEASSMTEDEDVDGTPAIEPSIKKRGRKPRIAKLLQDETALSGHPTSEEASPINEDETVSSTEDIPTVEQPVKRRGRPPKNPSPIKIILPKVQLAEETSTITEDETVSSTRDIPSVEQPNAKKNKVKLRKIMKDASTSPSPPIEQETVETLAASSIEDLSTMEPPVIVKKRGRGRTKSLAQADTTLAETSVTSLNTTEDETVSSTEDIATGEKQPVAKRRGRPPKVVAALFTEDEASESLAESSMEDLSSSDVPSPKKLDKKSRVILQDDVSLPVGEENSPLAASHADDQSNLEKNVKRRGRKPRGTIQDDSTCSESLTASSMEDLSTLATPVIVKRRGRPPKALSPIKIKLGKKPLAEDTSALVTTDASVDSADDFSPVKQLSPQKKTKRSSMLSQDGSVLQEVAATPYQPTLTDDQSTDDSTVTTLSPTKRRGRPPKYPKEVPPPVAVESDPATEQTLAAFPGKRKARLPRRLSQDENILPNLFKTDVQLNESSTSLAKKPGRRRSSLDGSLLSTPVENKQQSPSEDQPNLGKRQGRPPRKFSPDEHPSSSAVPQSATVNNVQIESDPNSAKRLARPNRKYSHDDGLPLSSLSFSETDEPSPVAKKRGRPPKKLSQVQPKASLEESPAIPLPLVTENGTTEILKKQLTKPTTSEAGTISTTNLLRQQRKPRMASQPEAAVPTPIPVVTPVVETISHVQQPEPLPEINPVKKRAGRPKKKDNLSQVQSKDDSSQDVLKLQMRQRRYSQDDSMFVQEPPQTLAKRPKEFEDVQPKKRGRLPKLRELSRHFVMKPVKPQTQTEAAVQSINPILNRVMTEQAWNRMGRPRKTAPKKSAPLQPSESSQIEEQLVDDPAVQQRDSTTANITAADFLRTWTDRDESPGVQPVRRGTRQRRFSQDDSTLSENFDQSRNRLRRYSQGDLLEENSPEATLSCDGDTLMNIRKRFRSPHSDEDSMSQQGEKRPRVEKELCTQHSITKELVVQLTKIDKPDEQPLPAHTVEPVRDLIRFNLRRKLESNHSSGPPPLVPFEPPRMPPPTHNEAKLLMLMKPNEDKGLAVPAVAPQPQPAPQQFCIIFIPDALTSSESGLSKDTQPTATIVNFQPVPDAELVNKSVIYTPTTPTKIFSNDEPNRSFLCATCTQALDLVGRMEANVGMTEEDKCAIKCPYCSNDFQSLFYLEYHLRQEHLKCEKEKQCRHSGFNTLRIPTHDPQTESEIYITFALKCRSCYDLFQDVHAINQHVQDKHANLVRHKPALPSFPPGMVCYPPPPFKNGARPEVLHCPSDCICRIGIRSTDSPMQRAQMLKRCPNFMRRLEKIESAAYEVYTCMLCNSTFLMKDEVVQHLMKMHEVSCKFPCTKCLLSFRTLQLQEIHNCSETTIRDLDKLLNIVILPTDKSHDNSKYEDSSNDELGPIKTTPPPSIASASTPVNGVKRKNGVVIQRLTRFLTMQPPKKARFETPTTPVSSGSKKRVKTPCPKCQKKFAYRKSLNDHITYEHIIPCKSDEVSKNMAVELLRLVNNGSTDVAKIERLANALGKYTDDDGVSFRTLTMMDEEQENWNETPNDRDPANEKDLIQCSKCNVSFKLPANYANLSRRNNQQPVDSQNPSPRLCDRCNPPRGRRNVVNNGHNYNLKSSTNGKPENSQQINYNSECEYCGETFSPNEMKDHKQAEHSNEPNVILKCDGCSKVFYSARMLEKHKKMHHDDSLSNSRLEDDETTSNHQSVGDVSKDSEVNDTVNSSTSRRDSSDNNKEEEKLKCPRCELSAEKVSLKNHLKREHGVMAFICQFCGKLLIEISEVRHMLDFHIKSSRKNGNIVAEQAHTAQNDVEDLIRTLGKKRLHSLMMYHDFEGKCNNAIMRCPICPEQFATRESCRFHYQWVHDDTCLLCDARFTDGSLACKHKIALHNSTVSYVWAVQRLVNAIVHGLRLDPAHPSHVLYQELAMRLDLLEQDSYVSVEGSLPVVRSTTDKTGAEEAVPEAFLEQVVLSEDQLPGSGNMIEVVIGKEDSEDDLLSMLNLSPSYESSCEQPKIILETDAHPPEVEEEEVVVAAPAVAATTAAATVAIPTTPTVTTSTGGILTPATPSTAENYATSGVFKYTHDNGEEELVLAITDEDLVTYRDDIGSLAERISATCDSLSLEEITTMLRSYFENLNVPQAEAVELATTSELRTQ